MTAPSLPDWKPIVEVVEAPTVDPHYEPTQRWPRLQKLSDGRLAVDIWVDGERILAKAWKQEDHPNMAKLPANAPRAVKALYRAEVQLAMLRASKESALSGPMLKAWDAWDAYHQALRAKT